jgi:hypothetical protein
MRWLRALCAAGLMVGVSTPAVGQAIGMPVTVPGVPSGVTFRAGGALSNADAGKGRAAQVGVSLGGRRLAITGYLGRRLGQESGPDFTSVGASLTNKIFGGPLVPFAVNLQVAAAYGAPSSSGVVYDAGWAGGGIPSANLAQAAGGYGSGTKVWHVPVAVGISWVFPQPVVALKPWIAPRLDVVRVSAGGTGTTDANFGLSGGVSFGFLNGLGIDLTYDRVFAGGGASPAILGLGLSFTLK